MSIKMYFECSKTEPYSLVRLGGKVQNKLTSVPHYKDRHTMLLTRMSFPNKSISFIINFVGKSHSFHVTHSYSSASKHGKTWTCFNQSC